MQQDTEITAEVYAAKKDVQKADALIRAYLPFIRAEASRTISKFCTEQDDAFSIAMMAFHEAILGYAQERGSFLAYAAMRIRSRLLDEQRKQMHRADAVSLEEPAGGEDDRTLADTLQETSNPIEEAETQQATREEILELAAVMQTFGVSFADVADNAPKQERTLEACKRAIRWAGDNPELLEELLRTKKLPLSKLVKGSGVERKKLERHRKYILVMLLVQTNGYEIMRGHLRRVLRERRSLA